MTYRSREGWMTRAMSGILRTRWIVRAPIFVYRLHLGGIFGKRLLMLEHRGRNSGRARYTVVEIIDRPNSGAFVIVSGFGNRAQWYRNILANPRVRVYLGSRRPVGATARPLAAEKAAASLQRYADKYPRAWTALRPVLEDTLGAPISDEGTNLPMLLVTRSSTGSGKTAG